MTSIQPQKQFSTDTLKVEIYQNRLQLGQAAALAVRARMQSLLKTGKVFEWFSPLRRHKMSFWKR